MKIVEIHAVDWVKYDETFSLPNDFPPLLIRVIGYLVEDMPDYVSIAMQDLTKDGRMRVRDVLSVPRTNIRTIYEYDKPSARIVLKADSGHAWISYGMPVEPLDSVEKDAIKV